MWTFRGIFDAGLRIGGAGLVAAAASGCELSRPPEGDAAGMTPVPVDAAQTTPTSPTPPIETVPLATNTPPPVLPTATQTIPPTPASAPTPAETADLFYIHAIFLGTAIDGVTAWPSWEFDTNGRLPAGPVFIELGVIGEPDNSCILEVIDTDIQEIADGTIITPALPARLVDSANATDATLTILTETNAVQIETIGPPCVPEETLPPGVPRAGETVAD